MSLKRKCLVKRSKLQISRTYLSLWYIVRQTHYPIQYNCYYCFLSTHRNMFKSFNNQKPASQPRKWHSLNSRRLMFHLFEYFISSSLLHPNHLIKVNHVRWMQNDLLGCQKRGQGTYTQICMNEWMNECSIWILCGIIWTLAKFKCNLF